MSAKAVPLKAVLSKVAALTMTAAGVVAASVVVPHVNGNVVSAQETFGVDAVHFVVDVSGSMAERAGPGSDRTRMAAARESLTAVLGSLPSNVAVGLRSYPDDSNCAVGPKPLAEVNAPRATVGSAIRGLQANGGTPTADALRAAGADLRRAGYTDGGVIVLVSDGESNCGDPPCPVAAELRSLYGIDVTVKTVGFQISASGRGEMQCIADATGGTYLDVDDPDALTDSLQALAAATLSVTVDAPPFIVRSVGVGETLGRSPGVEIRATVRNTSTNLAGDVRASIVVTSQQRPFILRPLRTPGNLEAGDWRQIVWSFTPPLDFTDSEVAFTVTVTAVNAPAVSRDVTVALRGSISMDDAGPLLQGRERVVILGDSYSAGEGTRNYLAGTDTDGNPCHRSVDTYGKDLWPTSRTVLACSGAVTFDLFRSQHADVEPQLVALEREHRRERFDLALMTLGGNDADFGWLIIECLILDCADTPVVAEASCSASGATEVGSELSSLAPNTGCVAAVSTVGERHRQLLIDLVPRLTESYTAVDNVLNAGRSGADVTPIVVLAYPTPVPDSVRFDEVVGACTATIGLSYDEWVYAKDFAVELNAAVATAVELSAERGVPIYFVPDSAQAYEPSHTICDQDPYVNGLDVTGAASAGGAFVGWLAVKRVFPVAGLLLPSSTPADRAYKASYHPNANGYRAMTAALVKWSTTSAGRVEPNRTVGSGLQVVPLPPGPPLTVSPLPPASPLTVTSGSSRTVTVEALGPGAPVSVSVQSSLRRLGSGFVDVDGVARVPVLFDGSLDVGAHTLRVSSLDAAGEFVFRDVELMVEREIPVWERVSPVVALVAGAVFAVCAFVVGLVWLFVRRRRRRVSSAVVTGRVRWFV